MKNVLLIILIFSSTVFVGQNKEYDSLLNTMYKHSVPLIKPTQLSFEMSRDSSIIILDAREKEEFDISNIKNSIFIGYNNVSLKCLDTIPKDTKVVVYCSLGARSEIIGEKIKAMGYTNVSNLYGGIFLWKNQGHRVYKDTSETDSVHVYSEDWGKWLEKGIKVYE